MKLHNLPLALGIPLALLCSACDNGEDARQKPASGQILFVGKTFSNPYFVEMAEGVKDAGSNANIPVSARSGSAEADVRSQLIHLQSFLRQAGDGKRGVILAPASSGGDFNAVIVEANRLHVPIVVVDTALDAGVLAQAKAKITSTIASDNEGGARDAGRFVGSQLPSCGTVLLLVGVPQQATAVARSKGFEVGLRDKERANACRWRIVRRIANWDRDQARRIVSAIIPLKGISFDAIFGSNDQMALGAVEAFEQAPRATRKPIIVGFDAVPEAVQAVEQGRLQATMQQQPRLMGEAAVKAIRVAWKGGAVQETQSIPVRPITASHARK